VSRVRTPPFANTFGNFAETAPVAGEGCWWRGRSCKPKARLELDHPRLKELVAELILDKTVLQDVFSRNGGAFAVLAGDEHLDESYLENERPARSVPLERQNAWSRQKSAVAAPGDRAPLVGSDTAVVYVSQVSAPG
jgi:hypothetical protein